MNKEDIDHEYTENIICPYCAEEYEDSHEFGDDGEQVCWECGKNFYYLRNIEVTYSTQKM